MSDPVTNVEIEDVLSSIRKLVSDGDKARTRDPAPVDEQQDGPSETSDEPAAPLILQTVQSVKPAVDGIENTTAKPEKLLLTPAFMVVDSDTDTTAIEGETSTVAVTPDAMSMDDAGSQSELSGTESDDEGDFDWSQVENKMSDQDRARVLTTTDSTLTSTDHAEDVETAVANDDRIGSPGWADDDASATDDHDDVSEDEVDPAIDLTGVADPASDRSQLVATIAELEAAVGVDVDEYEPDGSEIVSPSMEWPGTIANQPVVPVKDADLVDDENDLTNVAAAPDAADDTNAENEIAERDAETDIKDVDETPAFVHKAEHHPSENEAVNEQDAYADDDLDDLLVDGAAGHIDDAALRQMVTEIVRDELAGPMGERITRNVRKLVRREIYRILSSQEFD